jgi:hypothetical protein
VKNVAQDRGQCLLEQPLCGADAESEELGRYGTGNSGCMAPEDPGAEATPPGAAHPGMPALDISVPTMPHGPLPAPETSLANATDTTGYQWTTGASNVRLLPFNPTLPSKPGIQNTESGNNMPWDLAPHTSQVDAGRKDQGWALLDRGLAPPTSDEDDPAARGTTTPAIGEDNGTCRALGK